MARLQDDLVTRERFDWDKVVQLFGRLKAAGMTQSDVNFLLRNLEVLKKGWDFISFLIIEERTWGRPGSLWIDEGWRFLCPGVQVCLESASSNATIFVGRRFGEKAVCRFLLSEDWVEVVPGVQVRRVNDEELQVRSKKFPPNPVVEEAGTADDEAGWSRVDRASVSRDGLLEITPGVSVWREPAGSLWRVQSCPSDWQAVDGSGEWREFSGWREVAPGVQIRFPGGLSASLVEVRKRV